MRPMTRSRHPARAPHDPAPSRWAYKLQRVWLTPGVRFLVRRGLPALLVAGLVLGYLGDPGRRDAIAREAAGLKRAIEERPEFRVDMVRISGGSDPLAAEIRRILPVTFPVSAFDLDLPALRRSVVALDAVAQAEIRVEPGRILAIEVTERVPALVWRLPDGLWLIDAEGNRIGPLAARGDRTDLPLVAGSGADRAAPEALALFHAARPILSELRGLVRVGERRWDAVLTGGRVVQLPETGAGPALDRVIALNDAQDLLARDIAVIDMRNGARPTVRMNDSAIETLRAIWEQQHGEDA